MNETMHHGLSTLEWLGVIGSFASILSIVLNFVLGSRYGDLKKQLETVVVSIEGILGSIEDEADRALSSHAAHREKSLAAIRAHAGTGKVTVNQLRRRFLKIRRP